ncbi:DsbA family protein [Roseovarius sp. C7]|uniref:DsbA family protein n=1 Tax=Roseovarius sp. C7 TaxID=3398643 RepID=UPI0039F6FD1A
MNKTSAIGATALVIGLSAGLAGAAMAADETTTLEAATEAVESAAETVAETAAEAAEATAEAVGAATEAASDAVTETAEDSAEAAETVEAEAEASTEVEAEAETEAETGAETETEAAEASEATEAEAEGDAEADAETENAASTEEAADDGEVEIVEMVLGNEDATVTVTEYASFTCPHCANFHQNQFKQLKADFIDTGKIRFVYRDVYFDRYGLWASMVARCEGPSKFFGISNLLYAQQREWMDTQDPVKTSENLRRLGRVAGLDGDKLTACLEDEDKARALVAWWQENGEADEIKSTPTILINGESHGNMSYDDLKELIEAELAE